MQFVTGDIDFLFLPNYTIGMPRFGRALHAPNSSASLTPPDKEGRPCLKTWFTMPVVAETKSSGDPALDQASSTALLRSLRRFQPMLLILQRDSLSRTARRAVELTARVINALLDDTKLHHLHAIHTPSLRLGYLEFSLPGTQEQFPEDQIQRIHQ